MSKKFIVKVQLPQASSVSDPPTFIYNEDRSLVANFPVTPELVARMGGDQKAYFWAHTEGLELRLDERAPEQTW